MSARMWKLGVAGLGALTLSCATLEEVARNTPLGETGATFVRAAGEVGREIIDSDCEKLRESVSFEEERALGGAVALNWVTGGEGLLLSRTSEKAPKLAPEEALQEYINVVGRNLAAQSSRPTLPWTFGVLKASTAFNATSAPGGYVFVTRGLLQGMENEAQLAGVLAHEIAHVTLHHALSRYDDVKVNQCRTMAVSRKAAEGVEQATADIAPDWLDAFHQAIGGSGALDLDKHVDLLGNLTGKVVEKVVTEGYAKEDEFAADEVAVRLLVSAGYEPREYIRFLDTLPEGRGNFAHHPRPSERQARLNKLLARAAQTQKEGEFPELPATDGLARPTLAPAFAIVRSGK